MEEWNTFESSFPPHNIHQPNNNNMKPLSLFVFASLFFPSNGFQGIQSIYYSVPSQCYGLNQRRTQPPTSLAFVATKSTRTTIRRSPYLELRSSSASSSHHPDLERTVKHLKKLSTVQPDVMDPLKSERDRRYRAYLQQPANALKMLLKDRGLPQKGRKPDLADRLVQYDMDELYGDGSTAKRNVPKAVEEEDPSTARALIRTFAGMPVSETAAAFLASFPGPSPIQRATMAHVLQHKTKHHCNGILHAATGSGKTIAYLLPVTEALWDAMRHRGEEEYDWVAFVLTPTRELAAQVASVAQKLAPAHTVHHVTHPLNLIRIDKGIRIFVGSAKAIHHSLYGDGSSGPPTPKPAAMQLLQNTRYLVLDEVDRLLLQKQTTTKSKQHERPAAVVTAAIVRLSLGSATVLAASATAGRPVRRELARCMGLPPQEGPAIIRAAKDETNDEDDVVQIPATISHFFVDAKIDASPGALLTTAYGTVLRQLADKEKVLLVLPRNFGISTTNAIGALQHFGARVSSEAFDNILVSTEDSIRGMDWNVDDVILVGRPMTPADYTHICGRTGRAGKAGRIITVGNLQQWESMLNIRFQEWKGEGANDA